MSHLFKFDYYKQTALLILCGLLPFSCYAQQRTKSDVINIAQEFAKSNAFSTGMIDLKLQLLSSSISLNDNLQKGKEAYYILASPSNEAGFVIVSGDKRMPAVLAYSDENSFNFDSIPANVRYWLDTYVEAFLSLDNSGNSGHNQPLNINPKGVNPLIENNKWGQSDPFNRLCPSVGRDKCVTGCVATAMAQVMKYYSYPSVGNGSISYTSATNKIHVRHDFNSIQFKWDEMLDDYNGMFNSEQANAVAELMYSCGVSVKMDYGTSEQGGSGAYQNDLVTAFVDNFGYDQDAAFMARSYCSIEDWHNLLVRELNEGRPVNYGGQSIRDGGHSFVFDGYRTSEGNIYPDYHVNWGWKGACNGYYQIADLHPVENGQHATSGGFNSSQQMTIGIKPDDGIDDESLFLCTPNLHVSTSTAKAGSSIQVYTASCVNFSYKNFSGTLHVALIPSDGGDEIVLGESKVRALSFMQEQNNVSIDIVLPSDLADGHYTVQLRSKQSRKETYNQVLSKKYPEIIISDNGSDNPVVANEAMLGCSELELVSTSNPSLLSLNVYELQNLQEEPFIGDLRMILSDKQGKQLCVFGDSIQPGELGMFEIQTPPFKIQGELEGNWPDGEYKIYLGARLINTSNYVYVAYYDIAQSETNYQELCLHAKIENGNLLIDGKTFYISPTYVRNVRKEQKNNALLIRVDGMMIPNRAKQDLYLFKKSDGTVIKLMSK